MSDNPYIRLHGSDNRAAARGWDDGYAAGLAAGRAALPDPPRDCTCGEFCSGCGGRRAVTPDEGWSPGIDDPGPPALGDIDTGEGWYQT